jgi:gliding motility-associated-like protein
MFAGGPGATFTENKGQWPSHVLYRARIPGGALYVEREALTYVISTGIGKHHHDGHVSEEEPRMHAWRVNFVGGTAKGNKGTLPLGHVQNFFLGNDPARWGTGCEVYGEVVLLDVWPGVDLKLSGREGLKYDLIVAPGSDPSQIKFHYSGQDGLQLVEGDLHVMNSVGTVLEKAPVVFQDLAIGREKTEAQYSLKDDLLTFNFPEGFDQTKPLIIDPEVSFGSYSGSTADNFGFTATYDADGHLYGAGVVFQQGYPTSVGAIDITFNGGSVDVGVSKWSPDGSNLIWSTYIGGSENEAPHSLVANAAGELFILGSTGSFDFPTTAGCYDNSFSFGPPVSFPGGYGFFFDNGADIFVAKINTTGTVLLGSTYFGGSNSDGLNVGPGLFYNYGDPFRGEIALNGSGEPVVSTSTSSNDLVTTSGAPQSSFGGGSQDAFYFRMNSGLTALLWATYHGGSADDSGYGVQFSSTGDVYCTGGTMSSDMPMAGSSFDASHNGGVDGYIARYNASGISLLSSTFVGTSMYDQCFFVQLDLSDKVYVVGQTRGNYPVTPGKYAVANSSQFIHKFSTDLSASEWSTRIGNGNGDEDISPSAFLVSDCGQIYFSGWGGSTNNNGTPDNSTTIGLPVSADAFQATTDGSDFYLMVLEPEAVALNYATFFGGGSSSEHVDGGTSRFDKNGKVYQAVCAGCGSQDDFPTTPGAWSNTNNSSNCNLGVVKFDLTKIIAVVSIDGPDEVCAPATIQFQSTSSGGDTYLWDFGDGNESNEEQPAHEYTDPDVYTVTLIVTDSYGCVLGDTATIQVTLLPDIIAEVDPVPVICPGGQAQLMAGPDDQQYLWSPPTGLNATDIQDPIASPAQTTTYQVIVSGDCGVDTTTVEVVVSNVLGSVQPDVTICSGESTELSASGGSEYLWSPASSLSDPTISNPTATPIDTTLYTVTITNGNGCETIDSVQVNVVESLPEPVLLDTMVCEGESITLNAADADWHQWQAAPGLTQTNIQSPSVSPITGTLYIVECGNACGSIIDSAFVDVIIVVPNAWPDTIVCPGMPVDLHASGGTEYSWSPSTFLDDPSSNSPICTPNGPIDYTITVTDEFGCSATATLSLETYPLPHVYAGEDLLVEWGYSIQLNGDGDGELDWSPADLVDDPLASDPWTKPEESTLYTLRVTDTNGCEATDQVWVIVNGSLFVPNTFTPNGDGINDGFGAWGKDISRFKLQVFNRWGEKIYETPDLSARWDGTYSGQESPIDTYVWRIDMEERSGKRHTLYGHVNLVR